MIPLPHIIAVRLTQTYLSQYSYIAAICYDISVCLMKFSILLQYLHIFAPFRLQGALWWGFRITITINFMCYGLLLLAGVFLCSPFVKVWAVLSTVGHCVDGNAMYIATGAVNVFTDFTVLLLPQGAIWKLQLPLKRKLGVSALFLVGIV